MKNLLGLELYRRFQKENEALNRKAQAARSENDAETAMLLVKNNENKQQITRYYIISLVLILIFIGLFTSFVWMNGKFKLLFVDLGLFVAWLIAFLVLFKINKIQKKLIIEEHNKKVELESTAIKLYKEKQESFYGLVVYIICINEHFSELYGLNDIELEQKWTEITDREVEIINKSINYDISIARYQQYFNEWLNKQGIYE